MTAVESPSSGLLHEVLDWVGAPCFVYDLAEVRTRASELRAALPEGSLLYYSMKANPLPRICEELRRAGCGAEVSSPSELQTALAVGFAPADILYTGPGKTDDELQRCVDAGVTVSSESAAELERLSRCRGADDVPALVRVEPAGGARMGLSLADSRQFGFQVDDAVEALGRPWPRLAVQGLHVYLGSQAPSIDELLTGFEVAFGTVDEVCERAGHSPEVLDLGGGFPWPYAQRGDGPPLAGLRGGIERALPPAWAGVSLRFESGRRLVASSGRLLTRVVDHKRRGETSVVVLDAGINVLGGMSGLGRVVRPTVTFDNLTRPGAGDEAGSTRVVGPLCTPLDRLSTDPTVAAAEIGDVLAVPNAGAYGLSASLVAFLSRSAPVEVVVDGDEIVGAWHLRYGHAAADHDPIR